MDALEALHTRVSAPRLGGEAPDGETLDNILKAALRAPDHALLRPWRFLTVTGEDRYKLGDLFVEAAREDDAELSEPAVEKIRNKPLRAPMMVIAIARITPHPKVPETEQVISAGAAVYGMLVAAHAQGVGAMWRTGSMAYHPRVMKGLGLEPNERLVGYLYLGQVEGRIKPLPELEVSDYFAKWPHGVK